MTEPDRRQHLGQLVHATRLAFETERAKVDGRSRFLLGTWDERTEEQRDLDMRIGDAVAAHAAGRLAELENAVAWGTSCTSCARVLDSAYAETCRREEAEAKLAAIAALCHERAGQVRADYPGAGMPAVPVSAGSILAIIDGEARQ